MERPIPEADPVALARMKYELANQEQARTDESLLGHLPQEPRRGHGGQVRHAAMTALPPVGTGQRPCSDIRGGAQCGRDGRDGYRLFGA